MEITNCIKTLKTCGGNIYRHEKALDILNHDELEKYGFRGVDLDWVGNKQQLGERCEHQYITSRIPERSVSAPKIVIIYINFRQNKDDVVWK